MHPMTLRNLTMASAKHLVKMGHITKQHHDKIVSTAKMGDTPKSPKIEPKVPEINMAKGPTPLQKPGDISQGLTVGMLRVPDLGRLDARPARGNQPMYLFGDT